MIGFITRRLCWSAFSMLLLSLACFLALRTLPGGPFDALEHLPESARAALATRYGLDLPWPEQWWRYLLGLVHFDLGPSLAWPDQQVHSLVHSALVHSAVLGLLTLAIAVPLGWGLALLVGGWHRPGVIDALLRWPLHVPSLVLAPILVWAFAIQLPWLPVTARLDRWSSLLLPALTLALPIAAQLYLLVRARAEAELASAYALAARAAGIHPNEQALRSAVGTAPLALAFLAPASAGLLTGALVVEQVYSYPGLGRYFVLAAMNRDYPLLLAVVMLFGVLLQAFGLVADLLARWADPRLGWD